MRGVQSEQMFQIVQVLKRSHREETTSASTLDKVGPCIYPDTIPLRLCHGQVCLGVWLHKGEGVRTVGCLPSSTKSLQLQAYCFGINIKL